jgi:regulator of protease activity HflC (stomatin/prohibitin superfamily)
VQEVLVLFWGRLNRVYRNAGLYFYNPIGRTVVRVSTRTEAFEVARTVVVDVNGNPISVRCVA